MENDILLQNTLHMVIIQSVIVGYRRKQEINLGLSK